MEYSEDVKAQWTELYGAITTITFMVYGEIGKQDNTVLNYAIKDVFDLEKYAQLSNKKSNLRWIRLSKIKKRMYRSDIRCLRKNNLKGY